ncbi:sigma-70 family RNA polymerase sigma factor [Acetobacter orientalis]|uniref:RNA polymerase sigma factor n=1 Tax=Acetobacter orientalis TaxID=146474 RepID=UPI00209CB89F|nr:sigma-70 family RNA polymerase sigma factor [Acetobacter orientalis]MCP1216830.1 sigma-70 family RNA polymerase sigma factor [Acetobacter orientalis]MCP1219557.1 sigma-70 family RNA polymerase sigma factor [Acetobacter orientalis]
MVRSIPLVLQTFISRQSDLIKYAETIVPNHGDDIVQEAWFRINRTVAATVDVIAPDSYLFRVVRNLAIDVKRKLGREAETTRDATPEEIAEVAALTSPERDCLAAEQMRMLREAIDELPERTRIALEMRRSGQYKLREIAEHLGVSVGVAHDIIARGIAHCRSRVRSPE